MTDQPMTDQPMSDPPLNDECRQAVRREAPPVPVIIVGGGFSGATAAVQLVRRSAQALAITVVEPRPRVGPGLAYSATDPDHRLNGPVLTHAIDPEDPADLLNWCERTGVLQRDPGAFSATGKPFVRRSDFGHYLAQSVQAHAHWPANGSTIRHVQGLATGANCVDGGVTVQVQGGDALHGAMLIVATGNPRPRLRAPFDAALQGHPRVWADPLDPARPLQLPPEARVLLVGSGLTALDLMATLLRQGHRGPVDVLSRRGLRPRPQAPDPVLPPGVPVPRILDSINAELPDWLRAASRTPTARSWTRALRARIRSGQAGGETWHAGFDELRNVVWRAWPLLPPAEQRRFLQRLRTWYDMHRFRTPPMTDARIRDAESLGQVRYRAARVQHVGALPDGTLQATWTDAMGLHTQSFDAVVNCTGLDATAQVDDNPLLASLRSQGQLQVDPAGIGFAVDAHGCAIGRDGRADPRLRIIGPPTAGTFGDPLGAMFIAAQVHRMLPHWLQTLAGVQLATGAFVTR
jgi:uncharacterized NAD(P)/FAD-binding protein YdhS